MRIIFAVWEDLYVFARDALRDLIRPAAKKNHPPAALPPRFQHTAISGSVAPTDDLPLTFRSAADILDDTPRPQKNTVMYARESRVHIFIQPTMMFDGIIGSVPYGAMVMVLEGRGRWVQIVYQKTEGWALRDALADRSAYIYPDFTIGVPNLSDDPSTLRTRACIADEFACGVAELPLHSSEYVLYKLYRRGLTIAWPPHRPRTEGTWHQLLKGRPNVHVGVQPCTGCVMEYVGEDDRGHLAYVEGVLSDETIQISEVNYPDQGIYNERVLTHEEWRELRPVFMDIQSLPSNDH